MKQIDKLILCSPYKEPHAHWFRDPATDEFYQKEGRRPAGFTISGGANNQVGDFIELELANKIRKRLKEWQNDDRPGLTGVSRDLIDYWYDDNQRNFPLFFCQLEAIETIIFLNEAPANYITGIEIPSDGGNFIRWCSKMATGSGKTIVMAMLIAYNILNKIAYKQDTRYSKDILVIAPGLTVKSRLSVLYPADEDNYYKEFSLVQPTSMEKLRQGRVKIINWHMLAWDTQEKLDAKAEKGQIRSVDKRKQIEISDTAYTKSVLGEMANASNILVINDEAHHAWRTAAESKVGKVKREEIDNTIWIGGLDKLSEKVNILRCHDFSATPFAPTGKKTTEIGLYDWIISDFGLNDAIESGLVKTPRVVFRDDGRYSPDYRSRLYHIYMDKEVKDDINQKQIPKEAVLPDLVKNAYDLLGADWLKTKKEWQKQGINIPPAMISIANTTVTADRIKHFFDSGECEIKELCDQETTLQIDSKILGQIENEDESLSGSIKEYAEQLRGKVDTVGKPGKPGEQIQNVISVSMLSEGWDAKNVTQIMGLRAFSSQLLCEQVVGRGLRRISYEFDENKMLQPEYVNIFGVPFSFIPHEGGVSVPRPQKQKFPIEPVKEKEEYKIEFPNIIRVDTIYKTKLSLNYDEIQPIVLNPEDTITQAELGGIIQSSVTPADLTEIDIKKLADKFRRQTVIFRVATKIFQTDFNNWKGNQYDFLSQLIKLTEEFLESDKIKIKVNLFNRDSVRRNILLTLNMYKIIQHFSAAINKNEANIEEISPVFDSEKPIRSTDDMPTWYTSKPHEWHEKCHINNTVFDSTWEANNASILNKHKSIRAFVKNEHLGFSIKYNYRGIVKNYFPDYIVELNNGEKLILEVKGQDSDENRVKRDFLNRWVMAVNANCKFGKWHWAVVFNSSEIYDILETYKDFPKEAFLPQPEKQKESELQVTRENLIAFYPVSLDELKRESSVEGMVQKVIRTMLNENISKIYDVIRKAVGLDSDQLVEETDVQEAVYSALDGLTPADSKKYDGKVRNFIREASKLEKQSFNYLLSGEYMYDSIVKQMSDDFSIYVLQISRSVESELLLKIFIPFNNFMRAENPRIDEVYADDLVNDSTSGFAKMLLHNNTQYTLGFMYKILRMAGDFNLLEDSLLIQDFHEYIRDNFNEEIYGEDFLSELYELSKKYRNKSAHINTISREKASDCKFLIRKILTRFLNYL